MFFYLQIDVFIIYDLDNGWGYRYGYNGAPIAITAWGSNGHVTDDVT